MIRLDKLVYTAGVFRLDISLVIQTGEYFVIMGPTGSGKTAAVECLAGLRPPQSGTIEIGGRQATFDAPRLRGIGYVPQDYALFMHRSVRRNIGFAPEIRGCGKAETQRLVQEAARMLGIEALLDRRIQGLSGGERQRVALARALAMRPEVLVLDEPVSALDESSRDTVCRELLRLQRELRLTTVHISHNQEEAFSVADRAAVMLDGRIEQVGTMSELLCRPRTEFVARFMRCENVFSGHAQGPGPAPDTTLVQVDGARFVVPGRHAGPVTFMVRPENWTLAKAGRTPDATGLGHLTVRVTRAVDRGAYVRLELSGARRLVAHVSPLACREAHAIEGAELRVAAAPAGAHVLLPA